MATPRKAWLSQEKAVKRLRRSAYIYLAGLIAFFVSGSYRHLPLLITVFGAAFGVILVAAEFHWAQKVKSISSDEWIKRVGER